MIICYFKLAFLRTGRQVIQLHCSMSRKENRSDAAADCILATELQPEPVWTLQCVYNRAVCPVSGQREEERARCEGKPCFVVLGSLSPRQFQVQYGTSPRQVQNFKKVVSPLLILHNSCPSHGEPLERDLRAFRAAGGWPRSSSPGTLTWIVWNYHLNLPGLYYILQMYSMSLKYESIQSSCNLWVFLATWGQHKKLQT